MGAAKTRSIKRRIRSVRSTQQITRAMKMVAAAKLRRAQERMLAMRPYCRDLEEMLAVAVAAAPGDEDPLVSGRPEPASAALVVMSSDRGLCGSFNNSIIRRAEGFVRDEKPELDVRLVTIGSKAHRALSRARARGEAEVAGEVEDVPGVWDELSFSSASDLADSLFAPPGS